MSGDFLRANQAAHLLMNSQSQALNAIAIVSIIGLYGLRDAHKVSYSG